MSGRTSALSDERTRVAVIGGGAWGTALALHCARMGHDTLIWALEPEVVGSINSQHENATFLKGNPLPPALRATGDLAEAATFGELLLVVVPTPFVERTVDRVKGLLTADQMILSCTKGITVDTLETPHDILLRVLPGNLKERVACLSGPSFAADVARELPTAVTVASTNEDVAQRAQELLSTPRFRCYRTTDVKGVELCGALKNVLAIACGISDGLQFGANARAALITRGLDEITRLAVASGANPLTMAGLSGIGDVVLTCTGDLSRNRTVGLRIGRGEKLSDIVKSMTAVAEGVLTSKSAYRFAQQKGIECPVIEGIYRVINEEADPVAVVTESMSRPLIAEPKEEEMERIYSIDVECVATGTDHNSRGVAQISLVDQFEQVLLNAYVKPEQPVVSYLTPLTGLTRQLIDEAGIPLETALLSLRQLLPPTAILVGQNISKDVQWLGLREGQDFKQMMDLTGLFRVFNPKFKSFSVFGQDHLAKVLLGWNATTHNAVGDAIKSMRLFNFYQQCQPNPDAWQQAQQMLLNTMPEPSFAKNNPSFEGVCMGNRKTCVCGAAFLG